MHEKRIIALFFLAFSIISSAEDLVTNDGRTYRNYTVINANERGLMIQYQAKRFVSWSRLPDTMREEYQNKKMPVQKNNIKNTMAEEKKLPGTAINENALKRLEYITDSSDIKVMKIIDDASCILTDSYNSNTFIVKDIDTSDLFEGGSFPKLDTYYRNHDFSPQFKRVKGRKILSAYSNKCSYCGLRVPKSYDKEEMGKMILNKQKEQCSSGAEKRHRFFYIGSQKADGVKRMVFTVKKEKAVLFAEKYPERRCPVMRRKKETFYIPPPPELKYRSHVAPAVNANSTEAVMLRSRGY